MTPMSNQPPQPQDSMPQQERCIMRRTRAQGWEMKDRIEEGGEGTNNRKKCQKRYRHHVQNEVDLGGRGEKRRRENIVSVDVDRR